MSTLSCPRPAVHILLPITILTSEQSQDPSLQRNGLVDVKGTIVYYKDGKV